MSPVGLCPSIVSEETGWPCASRCQQRWPGLLAPASAGCLVDLGGRACVEVPEGSSQHYRFCDPLQTEM